MIVKYFGDELELEDEEKLVSIFRKAHLEYFDDIQDQQFYFMCITMTVVGYGDSVSMPDLLTHPEDYTTLSIIILSGTFMFSYFSNLLGSFFRKGE